MLRVSCFLARDELEALQRIEQLREPDLGPRVRSRPNGHGGCLARCQSIICQKIYCQIIFCYLSSALTGPSTEET